MGYRVLFLVVLGLLVFSLASADVPKLINFQGRLTDSTGKFVTDGDYFLTFRLYSDSTGGSAKWTESRIVTFSKGLFNVILGSDNPIPDSIFNYPDTWLGIQIESDPEMSPRQRLSSLGYSYRTAKADTSSYSMDSDKLDGYDATDFSTTGTDYGRSGVANDLYEGTTTLTDKYVNEGQANSVTSSMITDGELLDADISASAGISSSKINDGSGSGLDADLLDGQEASAFLSASSDHGRSGVSDTLYEGTTTLTDKYVNEGQSNSVTSNMITNGQIVDADVSASSNINPSKISGTAWTSTNDGSGSGMDADLLDGQQASSFLSVSSDYGRSGVATNLYEGTTTLTNKYVNEEGPQTVNSPSGTAFTGSASGSSDVAMAGIEGYTENSSTGHAFGGSFSTSPSGTGTHYGIRAEGFGNSISWTYGSYGKAENTSSGNAYGGYFETSTSGTGTQHYGVVGMSYGSSSDYTAGTFGGAFSTSSGPAYGFYGYADNTSNGDAYGGFFTAASSGAGSHYGMRAEGSGNGWATTYGCYGYANNSSTGNTNGGYFQADSAGAGSHIGVEARAYGNSETDHAWGIVSVGAHSSSGQAMGGNFEGYTSSGQSFGSYAQAYGYTSGVVGGVTGGAYNYGTGKAYGGYFHTSSGSGVHYGVLAKSWGSSDSSTYGIHSEAENTSSGNVYAGYFGADSTGSGTEYGVFSQASVEYWAGWFQGDLGVSRNHYVYGNSFVYGTKSATVKVGNGEYRALYSQESPESWFEDFGEGQLINGQAHIELDPLFLQTVTIDDLHPMKVFVQLEGDCNGVFVNKELTGFNVIELRGGATNVAFSYRVVAKRKGYEDIRMAKIMSKTPKDIALEQAKHQAGLEKERVNMEEEVIKMEQHRQEMQKEREKMKTESILPVVESHK